MATLPYNILSMDHVTRTGVNFTTRAEGIADLGVMGHYVQPFQGQKITRFSNKSIGNAYLMNYR